MRLVFYGVRGSYPVSGAGFRRTGGHTACVALEAPRGLVVVDAGTGLAALGEALSRRRPLPPITLLFTHFHLDHVAGITAFRPLFDKRARVTLMADAGQFPRWVDALRTLSGPPFWPVRTLSSGARVRFEPLPPRGRPLSLHGIRVAWCPVRHPQGGVSYRFSVGGREIVLATDRESGDRRMDRLFLGFCRDADLLIHDAQFTPGEYPARAGWGHSTWASAARVAAQARVRRLLLTSHDPSRTDAEVERFARRAQRIFRNTAAAREGMKLQITGGTRR